MLAGSALTTQVPTCSVRDRLGDVRGALDASPLGILVALDADAVLVTSSDGRLLGLLERARGEQATKEST
ncbi:MAG: hypothetical protein WD080_04580 [Egibacteraceae bacterium]